MSKKLKFFVLVLIIISSSYLLFSSTCGCDETYMGQHLTAESCGGSGGNWQWRKCYYGGAEKIR